MQHVNDLKEIKAEQNLKASSEAGYKKAHLQLGSAYLRQFDADHYCIVRKQASHYSLARTAFSFCRAPKARLPETAALERVSRWSGSRQQRKASEGIGRLISTWQRRYPFTQSSSTIFFFSFRHDFDLRMSHFK